MVLAANLGFPRVGVHRELKFALESFWKKTSSLQDLLGVAKDLRVRHWTLQRDRGMDIVPSNDFSLYDHILDTTCLLGAVPERYGFKGGLVDHD
ncbi:MAG: 5-methyltetrahydropteroyltriglutamate--homocysteine S-methyltransferase, partial [Alphaproteobacteria bacterium]